MKKNLNVIQIRGLRGIAMAVFVVSCLAAGFIAFPALICMHLWNLGAEYCQNMPQIGIIQGVLLWAILVISYFTFRKDKLVVCVRSPQGLSEEELKAVFADIKKVHEDPIVKAMMKAREAELKTLSQDSIKESEPSNHNDVINTENTTKL